MIDFMDAHRAVKAAGDRIAGIDGVTVTRNELWGGVTSSSLIHILDVMFEYGIYRVYELHQLSPGRFGVRVLLNVGGEQEVRCCWEIKPTDPTPDHGDKLCIRCLESSAHEVCAEPGYDHIIADTPLADLRAQLVRWCRDEIREDEAARAK